MLCVLLDVDDPSIDRLVLHFNSVIEKIADGTWKHFVPTAVIKSKANAKVHGFYLRNLAGCLTYDDNPRPAWLERSRLKDKIFLIHDKVCILLVDDFHCSQFCVGPHEFYEI